MKFRYYSLWLLPLLLLLQVGEPDSPQANTNNYALFFAVNDYQEDSGLSDLKNPIPNAKAIAKELREKYTFQTEVVENPTMAQIFQKFAEYEKEFKRGGRLDPKGQLLIFFSGHGVERYNQGYFMPADAQTDNPFTTALAYDLWRNRIDALNCQHVLVAIDACHSAYFDPKFETRNEKDFKRSGELSETERILEDHKKYKARFFFTSDGQGEETPDRSNFTKKFLEALRAGRTVDGFMTSSVLFANYLRRATPRPRGGDFGQDDANAHFLFFEKARTKVDTRSYAQKAADLNAWKRAQRTNTIEGYDQYLGSQTNGSFRRQAEEAIRVLADSIDWEIAQAQDTKEAYQLYLRQHPSGQYVEQANSKINSQTSSSRISSSNKMDLPDMVFVQGGTFQMGDQFGGGHDDEKPVHSVTVSDFYLSNHEVTFAEYAEYCNAEGKSLPADRGWGQGNRPVIKVSWNDAVAYCNWKSEQSGLQKVYTISGSNVKADWDANGYRLPTEAEWEYAARSRGKKEKWAGTSTESELSKYSNDEGTDDGYEYTAPVKSFRANDLGLYDMSGNVWEWCWDWFDSDYYASSKNASNPTGPGTGSYRVLRGGSWNYTPRYCRAADRDIRGPTIRNDGVGFRLASSSR
jgi:formylglycine-generating enzyme required for sulfatase activity